MEIKWISLDLVRKPRFQLLIHHIRIITIDKTIIQSDTPTAKARWVLNYVDFQIYSKAYKTNLFH